MKLSKVLLILSAFLYNSSVFAQNLTHTPSIVNVYDNGKLITAGKGKYKVHVRHNNGNLLMVKPTDPIWQDVKYKYTEGISIDLMYQNMPYTLKITDTVLGRTMILHSQLSIDSLPFVAGEYSIPTPYVQLFNLKPDSNTKVIGADISKFKLGTKQNYKKPEFAFKAVGANLFLAEFPLTKKAGAFAEQKNEYWMFNDDGSFNHKKLPEGNRIFDIQEIDKKHYYILVGNERQFNKFTHIYIFKHGEANYKKVKTPDLEGFYQKGVMIEGLDTMHVTYRGSGQYAEWLIYSSYNGGETWFKVHSELRDVRTQDYYMPALYLMSKVGYKRVGLFAKNKLIVYDSTGRIQDKIERKDYDYSNDKVLHVPRNYMNNHNLILESGKRLYFSSGKVMGIWAAVFTKTDEAMVICLHNSILVSKNNGQSWKYYAFENYEAPIRTYEEIAQTLNRDNLATIGIQDAILLQGNILVVRYGTSVYTLDISAL